MPRKNIVACSGGKDSTALALILHEQGVPFDLLWTSTGNEPPDVEPHIMRLAHATGAELIQLGAPTLFEVIERNKMIPNFWARFCTRQIKIEPCIEFFHTLPASEHVLHVGLRYDEPERKGIYDELINRRFILREMGWDVEDVINYVGCQNFTPPKRTDCMLCPFQGLSDWLWLWENHQEEYKKGCLIEDAVGHTFRSPARDLWPTALVDLAYEFHRGVPVPTRMIDRTVCRVCTL